MGTTEIIAIATSIIGALVVAIVALWKERKTERITKKDLQKVKDESNEFIDSMKDEAKAVIDRLESENKALSDEALRQARERSGIAERRNADAEVMQSAFDMQREAIKTLDALIQGYKTVVEANTQAILRLEKEREQRESKQS